jgi:hypothetical protein
VITPKAHMSEAGDAFLSLSTYKANSGLFSYEYYVAEGSARIKE